MIKVTTMLIMISLVLATTGCNTTKGVNFSTVEQHYSIATVVYERGDLHTAEGSLQQVLKTQPRHLESWCLLGHVYYRLNRYEAADNAYQKCLALRAEQPAIWHNLAAVKLRQATELLITGLPYLELSERETEFSANYRLLLQELAQLHGVSSLSIEAHVEN